MSIVFEPQHHADASGRISDCRISLVTHYHVSKKSETKCMGLDIRFNQQVVKDLGIRNGDRIVARRDDDGSWWFTVVLPTDRGYTVRLGGSKQHNGRRGCAYFRISCTQEVASTLFGDERVIELDLMGVEGRQSCFAPSRKASGIVFAPAC